MDLVPGLNKFIEVLASGIGSIAGPILAPWVAERENAAKLIEAKGDADVAKIRAEAMAEAQRTLGEDSVVVRGEVNFGAEVRQRIDFQERKQQANIVAVANRAAHLLRESKVPDVEPDHDWTARFFGEVQDVSSEDMQAMWGSVLAGEVQAQGATSLRTLGILKDLDSTTARLFSRLCSVAVYLKGTDEEMFDARVPSLGGDAAQNVLNPYGLNFATLNRLNEHRLIIPDYNSFFTYRVLDESMDSEGIELYHQGVRWDWSTTEKGVKEVNVVLNGVALTVAGQELSGAVSPEPMPQYTEALKSFLQRTHRVRMKMIDST
ncbi:MAG: DUF2806 domain-containing protein [Gammaproteobacteria bacterium]|nr:DUF2806 domain-containing protein [Gammaproteobacteria bacterium]